MKTKTLEISKSIVSAMSDLCLQEINKREEIVNGVYVGLQEKGFTESGAEVLSNEVRKLLDGVEFSTRKDVYNEPKETLSEEKISKDAYLYRLRGNRILNWIDDLQYVNRYKRILKECTLSSTLEFESGIVRIDPIGTYIGHKFVPHVKSGFSFYELSVIMRYEIIKFEDEYGEILLSENEIEELKQIIYMYNRMKHDKLDMSDRKKLIHLEQSSIVLYYLLASSVILKSEMNGWCSLTFTVQGEVKKEYCTIFNEEQIKLLERVSMAINK